MQHGSVRKRYSSGAVSHESGANKKVCGGVLRNTHYQISPSAQWSSPSPPLYTSCVQVSDWYFYKGSSYRHIPLKTSYFALSSHLLLVALRCHLVRLIQTHPPNLFVPGPRRQNKFRNPHPKLAAEHCQWEHTLTFGQRNIYPPDVDGDKITFIWWSGLFTELKKLYMGRDCQTK